MGLYERILEERAEEKRRGRGSSESHEGINLTTVRQKFVKVYPDRPKYSNDFRRMQAYLIHGVTNRFEAMHLASLRRRHSDEYWDLKYGRL
jgi:hypothetical protein